MLSKYLSTTVRSDSVHIIHEVLVRNIDGNFHQVKELIDCGATSMSSSRSLLRNLEFPHQPGLTSTLVSMAR